LKIFEEMGGLLNSGFSDVNTKIKTFITGNYKLHDMEFNQIPLFKFIEMEIVNFLNFKLKFRT